MIKIDEKKKFGERLSELRKKKKASQAEVADYIELTVAAYQNYETGRREAGYEVIAKLADFYGVTTDYLLGREPAPNPFADLNLDEDDEKEVISKYMSLPPEIRACMLDVLVQLGDVTRKRRAEAAEPKPQESTSIEDVKMTTNNEIQEKLYPSKRIARKGGSPVVEMLTQAEIDEIKSRPRADEDM